MAEETAGKLQPSEAAAVAYYEREKDRLRSPQQVEIRMAISRLPILYIRVFLLFFF